MKTIVFDARWINPEPSGIGIYARELLRRLPRLAPELDFVVLFNQADVCRRTLAETDIDALPNVRGRLFNAGIFAPRSQWRLPVELRRLDASVYHSPNYLLPYAAFPVDRPGRTRAVTTIHDVIPFVVPDHAPRSRKTRLWPLFVWCMRQSVARADTVITVSDASRRDLIRVLRLPSARAARIQRIYNGVDAGFSPAPSGATATPCRDAAAPRTLLYVGRLDPYKNVELLVRVFARLQPRFAFPLRLRIVGPPDARYPQAREAVRELGLEAAVSFEGFLDAAGLVQAYRDATVLAHPSRYEGFGLQLLEAMRCGLPVVCTTAGAMPEVVGEAALLTPPDDADAFAQALERVLGDPTLAERLRRAGLEQAARFTWERTAQATLELYRSKPA